MPGGVALPIYWLNVGSTVHLARCLLPDMVARGQGRVLFTASVASVSITAPMPGPTDTNFFHRAGMDDTKASTDKSTKR